MSRKTLIVAAYSSPPGAKATAEGPVHQTSYVNSRGYVYFTLVPGRYKVTVGEYLETNVKEIDVPDNLKVSFEGEKLQGALAAMWKEREAWT